jgi:hypothetical protein
MSATYKGSPEHNAHIEHLKAAAKKGCKLAIANLKQYGLNENGVKPVAEEKKNQTKP